MYDSAASRRLSLSDFIGGVVHGVEGTTLLNVRGESHHEFVATVEEKALYTHTHSLARSLTHSLSLSLSHTHTHTLTHTHTHLLAAVPVHI